MHWACIVGVYSIQTWYCLRFCLNLQALLCGPPALLSLSLEFPNSEFNAFQWCASILSATSGSSRAPTKRAAQTNCQIAYNRFCSEDLWSRKLDIRYSEYIRVVKREAEGGRVSELLNSRDSKLHSYVTQRQALKKRAAWLVCYLKKQHTWSEHQTNCFGMFFPFSCSRLRNRNCLESLALNYNRLLLDLIHELDLTSRFISIRL